MLRPVPQRRMLRLLSACHDRWAYRWFAASGGVMPTRVARESAPGVLRVHNGRRLSVADREDIAHLNRSGRSLSEIAEEIGFHKSTISRELRRNTTGGRYRASTAQWVAARRRAVTLAGRWKLAQNTRLRAEVEGAAGAEYESRADREPAPGRTSPTTRRCVCRTRPSTQSLYVQVSWSSAQRPGRAPAHLGGPAASPAPRLRHAPRAELVARVAQRDLDQRTPARVRPRRARPPGGRSDHRQGTTSAIGTLVERPTRNLDLLHLPSDQTAVTVQEAIVPRDATTARGAATDPHLGPRHQHGPPPLDRRRDRAGISSLTPLALAARHQREHQRPPAPLLPQRHRPVHLGTRIPRPSSPRDEQPSPQDSSDGAPPPKPSTPLLSQHDNPPGIALTG